MIGSCNGFQGCASPACFPARSCATPSLEFRCQPQRLRVERVAAPFTSLMHEGDVISIPVSHGDGNYYVTPKPSPAWRRTVRSPSAIATRRER